MIHFRSIFLLKILLHSSYSLILNCDFNYNFDWLIIGRMYTCTANSTFISHNASNSLTSVLGNHRIFKDHSDVKGLFIVKKEIFFLPHAIGSKFFKNIAGITINDSKLKEIHKSNLQEFPHLREIFIVSNQVESLEENLFEFNPNLELAWFDGNKIISIDSGIFDNLPKLRYLNIRERKACTGVMRKIQYDREAVEKFIEKILKRKCV